MTEPALLPRPQLRRLLRQARRALTPAQQRQAAHGLFKQLAQHPLFRRAQHIALYLPNDGEIDPRLLLDIRRMRGAADCHACGRCSGQRDAVRLIARSSSEEILHSTANTLSPWDVRLLLFGVIGLAMGAFQWTVSPWFIDLKQSLAQWLVSHDWLWALQDNAPWWLLTHYPQLNDSFSWLDGFCIVAYLGMSALLIGTSLMLLMRLAARLSGDSTQYPPLAITLTPLGGAGLFLGLSATTVKLLRYEGLLLEWVQPARAVLLIAAIAWSLWLGCKRLQQAQTPPIRRWPAMACLVLASSLVGYGWWLQFWGW